MARVKSQFDLVGRYDRSDKKRKRSSFLAVMRVIEQYAYLFSYPFSFQFIWFLIKICVVSPLFRDLFADGNFSIRSRQIDCQKENVGEKERRLCFFLC